jgi:hypothetical protein
MRLRIADRPVAMVVAQAITTGSVLGLCALAASRGTVWVALAWGSAQVLGGLAGYLISRTVPLQDLPGKDETVLEAAT